MLKLVTMVGVLALGIGCGTSSPAMKPSAASADLVEPPANIPPPVSVEGFTLGQPAAEVEARVPPGTEWKDADGTRRAEANITWKGRPTRLSLATDNGLLYAISVLTDKDDGKIENVRNWAEVICSQFAPDGKKIVSWSAPASRRYNVPFSEAVENGATLGCIVDQPDRSAFAGAANDIVLGMAGNGTNEARRAESDAFLAAFVPFDWSTMPHVGDPIDLGGFRYTIERITPVNEVGENRFTRRKATPGAKFIVVLYSVENTGNETSAVIANDLIIRDTKGRTFRRSSDATMSVAAEAGIDLLLAELQPGIPRKQVSVFEVPEGELKRLDLVIPEKGLLGSREVVLPLTFFEPK
jgi:hypothetical protein